MDASADALALGPLNIFGLANKTLREYYFGFSVRPLSEADIDKRRQGRMLPSINHWEPGHDVSCVCIASGVSEARTKAFAAFYDQAAPRTGWKLIRDYPES